MNTNDILKLVDAGFTADQIHAMDGSTADPAPASDPAPAAPAAPAAPDDNNIMQTLAGMQQNITQLTATMQAMLLKGAQTGAPSVETTPEILAHIVNPYSKEDINNGK